MPLQASPYTSVPNGISYPATPLDPQQAMMALASLQGMQGGGDPNQQGQQPGVMPPGASMSPPGGPPLDSQAPSPAQGLQDAQLQEELDIFQRVVSLMMDPVTKQLHMPAVLLFAGMGAARALDKTGKFVSKPHRSNEELAQMGVPTGAPGQTGMPSPQQMQPPTPPGMPGF